MKHLLNKRAIILFSVLVAVAFTSTSVAQVVIVNHYSATADPITPSVHLANGFANSSSINEYTNDAGSFSYVNISHTFTLGAGSSINLTGILNLPSSSQTAFSYLTNVTDFSGQNRVSSVALYSIGGNSPYTNDFTYNSTTGYSNGTMPVKISYGQASELGLFIELGKSQIGGPYTWNLNFEINGYATGNGNSPAVYTQYFVHISVTTVLVM